jgi:dTMP kinase
MDQPLDISRLDARRFIVVEGVDGAGKSEQSRRIVAALEQMGLDPLWTREPGGCEVGVKLREILLHTPGLDPVTQAMLMFADRREHIRTVIGPALLAGRYVVCDRFSDSSFAYQGGGHGVEMGFLRSLEAAACEGLAPALSFCFDVPLSVSRQRLAQTGKIADAFESQPDTFFERARAVYHARAKERAGAHIVDATGTLDEVAAKVRSILERHVLSVGAADGARPARARLG